MKLAFDQNLLTMKSLIMYRKVLIFIKLKNLQMNLHDDIINLKKVYLENKNKLDL